MQSIIGVKQLVLAANERLDEEGFSEKLTERTVRFYLSRDVGIIPQASEMNGTSSVFDEIHLYLILAVKKLQSAGLPLEFIRNLLQGKKLPWLKKLLSEGIEVFTNQNELTEFINRSNRVDEEVIVVRDERVRASVLEKKQGRKMETTDLKESWNRHAIAPGLEMHISERFDQKFSKRQISRLIVTVRQAVQEINSKGGN